MHALHCEQLLLGRRAAEGGEPADLLPAREHAMAGNDDGHGVAPHRLPDRAGGIRRLDLPRERAVGGRLAPTDAARGSIDRAVEIAGAGQVERDVREVDALAFHVPLQQLAGLRDRRRRLRGLRASRPPEQPLLGGGPRPFRQLEPDDAVLAPRQAEHAEIGIYQAVVHRRNRSGEPMPRPILGAG